MRYMSKLNSVRDQTKYSHRIHVRIALLCCQRHNRGGTYNSGQKSLSTLFNEPIQRCTLTGRRVSRLLGRVGWGEQTIPGNKLLTVLPPSPSPTILGLTRTIINVCVSMFVLFVSVSHLLSLFSSSSQQHLYFYFSNFSDYLIHNITLFNLSLFCPLPRQVGGQVRIER